MVNYDDFLITVKRSLDKTAGFIRLKDSDDGNLNCALVTRNKSIINYFDPGFAEVPYGENGYVIEAYELRTGKIVFINITDVIQMHHLGIPHEVPPPLYINPDFGNLINTDALVTAQIDNFLKRVKEERSAGKYKGHTVTVADYIEFIRTKTILSTVYKIKPCNDNLFCLLDEDYGLYNVISNTEYWEEMCSLQQKAVFLPIILKCLGKTSADVFDILPSVISGDVFKKEIWIEFLNQKRNALLLEYQRQLDEQIAKYANAAENTEEDTALHYDFHLNIVQQYESTMSTLRNISFEDALSQFDDYRLYLRYWPNEFVEAEEFHTLIRPFTDLEIVVLKYFITAGIKFDYNNLIRRDYDYFNSIIDTLQSHIGEWRDFKLARIKEIAPVRAQVLREEMKDVLEASSQEERDQLNSAINDVLNIENYERELNSLNRLTDVMGYWPAALSPAPAEALVL